MYSGHGTDPTVTCLFRTCPCMFNLFSAASYCLLVPSPVASRAFCRAVPDAPVLVPCVRCAGRSFLLHPPPSPLSPPGVSLSTLSLSCVGVPRVVTRIENESQQTLSRVDAKRLTSARLSHTGYLPVGVCLGPIATSVSGAACEHEAVPRCTPVMAQIRRLRVCFARVL